MNQRRMLMSGFKAQVVLEVLPAGSKTRIIILAIFWFVTVPILGVSCLSSKLLWVDDTPGCGGASPCYLTIQEAITAAQNGDTIQVRSGSYYGPIFVNKSLHLSGESKDAVILQNRNTDDGIINLLDSVDVRIQNLSFPPRCDGGPSYRRNRDAGSHQRGGFCAQTGH